MAKKLSKKQMKTAKGGHGDLPLYVIDGYPINPAMVEVLEGAAATSIYGARAADGVIVITSADAGRGFKVRFADAAKK